MEGEEVNFDTRLRLPNHAVFVGMSMSGKTRLVAKLLMQPERFDPPPKHVFFYYQEFQDGYTQLQADLASLGIPLTLRHGSDLKLDDFEKQDGQTIVIVDDATEETMASTEISKITTNGRHR